MINKHDILEFYKVRYDRKLIKDLDDLHSVPNDSLIHIDDCNNQIKKISSDEYVFIRKDTISTVKHEPDYDTANHLRERVYKKLQYNNDYADDRVKTMQKLFNDNESWLLSLVSSPKSIKKDVKNKKDFLSENQSLDQKIEGLASYILHSKFNSKEDEVYYNDLKDAIDKVKSTKTTSENVKDVEYKIKSEMDDLLSHIITKSKQQRNDFREELTDEIVKFESFGEKEENYTKESKPKRIGKKLNITPTYWKNMNFNDYEFRNNVINTYQQTIKELGEQLGMDLSTEEKEKYQQELMKSFDNITFETENDKTVTITPEQRLNKLNRMYSEVVSDFYTAKERLAEIITFQSPTKPNSSMQFTEDTWYVNEQGEEVEVSKNLVLFSDMNTYSGLIQNYYDLYDKYKDKFNHDMWAILHTFREVMRHTPLTDEELFVIEGFSSDKTREEIKTEYMDEFHEDISLRTLSNWVNKSIPKKMLSTYLESVDDWLYTYKIKGEFKKCSKCSEIKVISNGRYFGRDKRNKDGFMSLCKKCDSYRK